MSHRNCTGITVTSLSNLQKRQLKTMKRSLVTVKMLSFEENTLKRVVIIVLFGAWFILMDLLTAEFLQIHQFDQINSSYLYDGTISRISTVRVFLLIHPFCLKGVFFHQDFSWTLIYRIMLLISLWLPRVKKSRIIPDLMDKTQSRWSKILKVRGRWGVYPFSILHFSW